MALELATNQRALGPLFWKMILENQDPGTRYSHCFWPSQETERGNTLMHTNSRDVRTKKKTSLLEDINIIHGTF